MITFPPLRQDIAVVVAEEVEAAALVDADRSRPAAPELREARVFDVYHGDQVGEGRKSVAIHLSLQAPDRTLSDDDAAVVRDRVVAALAERSAPSCAAESRRLERLAAHEPHGALGVDVVGVGEDAENGGRADDALAVETLEAASRHRRRDAVAGAAGAAEGEDEA